ncbi:MAG TPA: LPS export ABC transporter periplasmic protein LptC [Stellaceae bacterium]|nr:LPS export ABC transporter periplasmic protein LptC [Stellaceae bacterium]
MNGWRSLHPAAPQARVPPLGARSRVALPHRGGDPYSRLVALLKRLLPAIGLTLLLLVAAWPRLAMLFQSVSVGFAAIDLREARELKMINPRYAGSDRQNRPYVLTAAIGRQMPDRTDLLSLERPRADMTTRHGIVVVTAATGIYQAQTKLLDLFRRVWIVRQDGTHFSTESAHVDFSDNSAEGHNPIRGSGPWGAVAAQGFRILDKGARVIFTGHADLVLKGAAPRPKPAAPPSLPPAVAARAAEIEAAAARSAAPGRRPAAAPRHGARHHAG